MFHSHLSQTGLSYQERFTQVVQDRPNHLAVIDGLINKTYSELDIESRRISNFLRAHGVGPQDLVIIYMSSSYEYICACLATLKAGAAFLPISVDLPLSQLELIFTDAQPKVILCQPQYLEQLGNVAASNDSTILSITPELLDSKDKAFNQVLEKLEAKLVQNGQSLDFYKSQLEHYAFATYTSGTTGTPKGVLQIQSALLASYDARHRFNPYQGQERVACNVFFMWEILRPLLVGGTSIVIPDALLAVPKKLSQFLSEYEVTEVLFTPSAFQRLIRSVPAKDLQKDLSGLRTIWLNGEVVTSKLVREALAIIPTYINLLNTYSICECHDVSNADLRSLDYDLIEKYQEGICPAGYADQGVIVKVKTDDGLKQYGKGELYISGHGLGAGYLHLEGLTAERFPTINGQSYYATGDLAELSTDGLITIKGRLGTMVKMRGYSVYLNSIEEALRLHPEVQDVRIFLRGEHLSQRLSAFIVGPAKQLQPWINESQQSAPRLREWLSKHLAPYMIPTKWIRLDYFPVHPISGKLDQESLWSLESEDKRSLESLTNAPQATWEDRLELMRQLWAQSLELDLKAVKNDSDFYDLGGHSLSMVDLVLSVEKVFGLKLDGDELYENPKLNDYLSFIFKCKSPANTVELKQKSDAYERQHYWTRSDLDIAWPTSSLMKMRSNFQQKKTLLSEAKSILLTGATGHLGLGLLEALLTRTTDSTQIICLVRPYVSDDIQLSGEQRLKSRYQETDLGDLGQVIASKRLLVIEGDITEDCLGLNIEQYQQLCREVDLVYHSAAFVNLRANYEQMKASIVTGSKNILHLCAQHKLKTLHYISTNSVAMNSQTEYISEEFVSENDAQHLQDGYSQAKWVAESLMEQAINKSLAITVYRPGNIGPHQRTAYLNPNDLSILIWSACVRQQQAPQNTNWLFELTPVDQSANLILSLSDQIQTQSIYHLVHPYPLKANELFQTWSEQGYLKVHQGDWESWRQELLNSGNLDDKVLGTSLGYFNRLLQDEQIFSIEHLHTDLPNEAKIYDRAPELSHFFQHFFHQS